MDQTVIYLIGSVLLAVAGIIGTASVIVHARVAWRSSPMGRHIMAYMVVIAAVLDLGVARMFVGQSFGFELLRLVVFAGVPLVMGQRLLLQVRAQRRERARPTPLVPPRTPGS